MTKHEKLFEIVAAAVAALALALFFMAMIALIFVESIAFFFAAIAASIGVEPDIMHYWMGEAFR
jgi:hypothetical protein